MVSSTSRQIRARWCTPWTVVCGRSPRGRRYFSRSRSRRALTSASWDPSGCGMAASLRVPGPGAEPRPGRMTTPAKHRLSTPARRSQGRPAGCRWPGEDLRLPRWDHGPCTAGPPQLWWSHRGPPPGGPARKGRKLMGEAGADRGQITVFLLDDHEIVRRGVHDLLEAEPDITVIGEAGTAESALARIPALKPDVAILDVRLPDGNGVTVCREIRSKMPNVACLM